MFFAGHDHMHGKTSRHNHPIANALNRGFWALMLLAHAPALVSAWKFAIAEGLKADLLGGCIFLTASMIFFALKIRGVAWLRFRADRRAFVALCLVVALIHLDCFRPGLRKTVVSQCAVVLVAAPLAALLPRVNRALCARLARTTTARESRTPETRSHEEAWIDVIHPHCWVLAPGLFRLRAPPI